MRPKLVAGISMLAALVGAGSYIGILTALSTSLKSTRPGIIVTLTLLLPIGAIVFASIFVYRHTARRRKLQALITAMLATLLTLSLFALVTILSARREQVHPPQVPPPHSAG